MLDLNGGRGRNRTFNLSVKSRMLCQLSYASRGFIRPTAGNDAGRRIERNSSRSLKNITQREAVLQRPGKWFAGSFSIKCEALFA